MWNYGKRIIQSLFEARHQRAGIRAELESAGAADCSRGDIRVFEAQLPAHQYGDNEQSTGNAAYEKEGARLIAIAKANGLYIPRDRWNELGLRKMSPSGESIIFYDEDKLNVFKVRNPLAKAAIKRLRAQDIIYEHLVHNMLFPQTRYSFIAISEDIDGLRIILRQQYIPDNFSSPSQRQIDDYLLHGLHLQKKDGYFYSNDYVAITDVSDSGDNVFIDGGRIYFIDPIIRLKRPATEVLNYYQTLIRQ